MSYALVLGLPQIEGQPRIEQIAEILAKHLKIVSYDATRMVRDAGGILVEPIEYDKAQKIAAELNEINIPAGVSDSSVWPEGVSPKTARAVGVYEKGVELQIGYGAMELFPWSRIALIGVCMYLDTQVVPLKRKKSGSKLGSMFADAIMPGMGSLVRMRNKVKQASSGSLKRQTNVSESYVCDFLCTDPHEIIRIQSSTCLYNYLGSRIQERAEFNFHTVIHDIEDMRDGTMLSPQAENFLRGDPLTEAAVDSLVDFERYNRWLFLAADAFSEIDCLASKPSPPPEIKLRKRGFEF